jgi:hypothetical protein
MLCVSAVYRIRDRARQEEGDQAADQQGQCGDDFLNCDRARDRVLGRAARSAEGSLQLGARRCGCGLHVCDFRRDLIDL